jgi:hypothetical protein
MEPISIILTSALGYIFKAASDTQLVKSAENDLLTKFWNWIKPHIVKTVPEIETKPEEPETEVKTEESLVQLVNNEDFFNELSQHVEALKKAGVREKNIVRGSIENVKIIRIGDKTYSPNDTYDRKNIVEGDVKNADEFTLGDG